MKYITITARNYDDAVKKARSQYGESIRIHSRRDVNARGGFLWLAKHTHVELTCYLPEDSTRYGQRDVERSLPRAPQPKLEIVEEPPIADEPEASFADVRQPAVETVAPAVDPAVEKTESPTPPTQPEPLPEQLVASYLERVHSILHLNDFSEQFEQALIGMMTTELLALLPALPSDQEFELMLVDKIVSLVEIDHKSQLYPPRIFVLLGPTGIGKTTTIAKIAALYGLQQVEEYRRKVRIITIDSFRTGAFEQISAFGVALGIPVAKAATENEFFHLLQESDDTDLILVDTIGKSPRDAELAVRMKTLLSVPKKEETCFYLAISGSMKAQDMRNTLDQYASYGIRSLVVTKTDETESVGTILSLCHEQHLPLLFLTDGQKVPKDIHKASASSLLTMLKGFSLDFSNLWPTQIDIEE
ncbi:MAG: hypothetical protein CVV52_12015 [Spirochaetae bacterium HGW-Spirochaetae-8]|nr:MAG: hypothetical protein CVV52_12015 [Spirochaetae bacterium HGW-Spirochaetae-8]